MIFLQLMREKRVNINSEQSLLDLGTRERTKITWKPSVLDKEGSTWLLDPTGSSMFCFSSTFLCLDNEYVYMMPSQTCLTGS